jgi:hypothetical protein
VVFSSVLPNKDEIGSMLEQKHDISNNKKKQNNNETKAIT